MSDDPISRLETKLDAHFASLQEHREDVVQRLTRIETTLATENFGERLASLETHRTYAKAILGTLTFLWSALLVWLKYRPE